MNDKITKLLLGGILICLVLIASRPVNVQLTAPNGDMGDVDSREEIIQLAPNRIAVVDNGINDSKERGKILVFDYDEDRRVFEYVSSMDYTSYFENSELD